MEQIRAFRRGDPGARPVFPPRALSEISDFAGPEKDDIIARRGGNGGPITNFYPPGSWAVVFTDDEDEAEAEVEAEEEEEEEEVVEVDAPSRRTRGAVKGGRVVKPQSKGKGKEKAKEKPVKARAPPPPPKRNRELKDKLAAIKWAKPGKEGAYGWEDDRWADLTGKW